jgi:hypothetical protein
MSADLLDRLLAGADPATGVVARRDPDTVLAAILEADPGPDPVPPRAHRRRTRIVLVAAAALALVAVPALYGRDSAYAGWTAYPAALSTGQRSTVAKQCQKWAQGTITEAPTRVVLSERRGDIGLALLTGPDGLLVTCELSLGGSGEPSGGASESYLTQAPRPDRILSDGGSGFAEDDGEPIFRVVSGRVGADVTGVVVHTEEQGDVIASVEQGYFTAWWPGPPESRATPRTGLPMDFSFTARLRDGTTRSISRAQSL